MSGSGYNFIIMIPILLFSIVAHEFAHAFAAKQAGDMTATRMNRLTLNPIYHIDIFGTIIIPIIAYISGFPLIGFAKPVPIDPRQFRRPYWEVIVSLAGICTNFSIAILATVLLKVHLSMTSPAAGMSSVAFIFLYFIWINVLLGLFNLIPIPPLDGSHVVQYYLQRYKPDLARYYSMVEGYGYFILMLFLFLPPTRALFHAIFSGIIDLLFTIFNIR